MQHRCTQHDDFLHSGLILTHSNLQEFNHDKETVRSLQIWMTPDRRNHEPQYGSSRYVKEDRHNKLLAILGGSKPAPDWHGIASGKGINLHQVSHIILSP